MGGLISKGRRPPKGRNESERKEEEEEEEEEDLLYTPMGKPPPPPLEIWATGGRTFDKHLTHLIVKNSLTFE